MGAQSQEVTETFTAACPPSFGDWPAVYALRCNGTCCEPEIADGSILIIDQQAAIAAGDFVAIWSLTSAGTIDGFVKRLAIGLASWSTFPHRRQPGDDFVPLLLVEALNPPRKFNIDVATVYGVHRCIGLAPARPEVEIGTDVDPSAIQWFSRPGPAARPHEARSRKGRAVSGAVHV